MKKRVERIVTLPDGSPMIPNRKKLTGVKFNLPSEGHDEVNFHLTGFEEANPSSTLKRSGKSGPMKPTSWTPGKTVKKFNFDDLPSLATLTDEVFKDDPVMSKTLGSILDEPKSPGRVTYKKRGTKGETFLGTTADRLRDDLLKVSEQIKGDLEAKIGFGFTKGTKKSPRLDIDLGVDLGKRGESHTKMVDKSITSLQTRIQEQRRKFQEYQTASLNFPLKKTHRPDTEKNSVPKSENFLTRKKVQENAKLQEIARIFRQSLEASAKDPSEVIRIPGREKSPARNPSQVTKGTVLTKPTTVGKPFLGKPKQLANKTPASKSGMMELRQLLESNPKTSTVHESFPKHLIDPLDFTQKKIRELESPYGLDPKFDRFETKPASVQFAEYLDAIDKEERTTTVTTKSRLGQNLKSFRTEEVVDVTPNKLNPFVKNLEETGTLAKNLGSLVTRVATSRSTARNTILLENETAGNHRKSMTPAEIQAVFTSAAPSDTNSDEEFEQNSFPAQTGKSAGPKLLSPSSIRRFPPSLSRNNPATSSTSRAIGKTVEIQTDNVKTFPTTTNPSPLSQPMKFLLPEIEFTKDMSETDQQMLKELRAMKSKWDQSIS